MAAHAQSLRRFALLFLLFAALGMLWMPHTVFAQTAAPAASADLTTMNLEDLMKLEVTSVSKKEQKISQVAAAIFVITQEDIHRSGATNIPDLLRMVPGLDVAQINANTWAISARGFNSEFANKLLVLIDGRAVYTPTLGGVDWDTTDVPLEDIERIEVIRGPGGTIWGANAVNGVINIITKKSSDTLGGLAVGAGGTQQQALGTLQYGGKLGGSSTYRIFSKYSDTNQSPGLEGQDARDDWHLLHGGFRVDVPTSTRDQWTFEGDLYTGSEGSTLVHTVLNPPENVTVLRLADLSGGTVLARWTHTLSDRSDTSLQVSLDNSTRSGPESYVQRRTFDIDFQHHIALGARHDIVWGGEFRSSPDHTIGTIDQAWIPADRTFNLFNVFLQDEITLKPNHLFLTLGTKLEQNNFSGVDVDPSIRLAWTPSARETFWWAVSTAYRTPSRRDQNINAVLAAFPGPTEVIFTGDPDFQSERVIAFESGYRSQVSRRVSFDISVYLNSYSNLETIEPLPPYVQPGSNPPLTIHQLELSNETNGLTGGVEISSTWKVTHRWTLSPGFAYEKAALNFPLNATVDAQGADPPEQARLRSHLELFHGLAWDANAYFDGNPPSQLVPSNTRLDSQLTWRTGERSELSIVGQNLLRDHHLEFSDSLQIVNSALIKRGVFAKFTKWF